MKIIGEYISRTFLASSESDANPESDSIVDCACFGCHRAGYCKVVFDFDGGGVAGDYKAFLVWEGVASFCDGRTDPRGMTLCLMLLGERISLAL